MFHVFRTSVAMVSQFRPRVGRDMLVVTLDHYVAFWICGSYGLLRFTTFIHGDTQCPVSACSMIWQPDNIFQQSPSCVQGHSWWALTLCLLPTHLTKYRSIHQQLGLGDATVTSVERQIYHLDLKKTCQAFHYYVFKLRGVLIYSGTIFLVFHSQIFSVSHL